MQVPLDQFVCEVPYPVCPAGCQCTKRPYNQTYVVKCPETNTMPSTLPDTRHPGPFRCHYAIDFHGSKLNTIDYRDYFNNTVNLDVSDSSVNNIADDAWRALTRVKHVDLSNNKLTVLPTLLQSENLSFKSIALHGNPWRFQCEDKWIRNWLESLGDGLLLQNSVLCASPTWQSGKSILSIINEDDFCSDPNDQKTADLLKASVLVDAPQQF
jgi:Leucine-rich repeat (LRR) protein